MADRGSASDPAQWSETYWAHHRNALLASGALLLVSLPNASVQVVKVYFDAADSSLAVAFWVLVAASTYTICNLSLEWWNEAYRSYRVSTERMREAIQGVNQTMGTLRASQQEISNRFPKIEAMLGRWAATPILPEDIGGREAIVQRAINSPEREARVFRSAQDLRAAVYDGISRNLPGLRPADALSDDFLAMALRGYRREIEANVSAAAVDALVKNGHAQFAIASNEMHQSVVDLAAKVDAAIAALQLAQGQTKRVIRPLTVDRLHFSARALWLGIGLPVSLYVVALLHALGRLGLDAFGKSWLISLIEMGPSAAL